MMPLWGHDCPLPALAALACLSPAGDGPFCSWLALSSVQFSCSVMSDSLRPHESQHAKPSCPSPTPRVHSVVSYVRAFHVVAIPQSGLLFQVSSFRLLLGHSGPVLTLSNAACASLPSPCLLVADAGICAPSLLRELCTLWHVLCGF